VLTVLKVGRKGDPANTVEMCGGQGLWLNTEMILVGGVAARLIVTTSVSTQGG